MEGSWMGNGKSSPAYRLAVFDFDGTLADSYGFFREAYDTLAVRHGLRRVEAAEVRELRGLHAREVMRRVGMPAWKLPLITRDFITMMRARRGDVPLFPGTAEMLATLRRAGVLVAVVSANARDNVEAILGPEAAGAVGHFACGMSMFGKHSHLRQALATAGVPSGAAIYIGDQAADLEAARAARMDFGAVAWGYGTASHLAALGATHVFERMEDIVATVAALPSRR